MQAVFADLQGSGIPNGGRGDLEAIEETDEVDDENNKNGVQENGNVPLKGETPPMERHNLMRKMTQVTRELREATRDLREDGRDWVNKHLRKKESHEDDSSGSDEEKERKGQGTDDEKRTDSTTEPK